MIYFAGFYVAYLAVTNDLLNCFTFMMSHLFTSLCLHNHCVMIIYL